MRIRSLRPRRLDLDHYFLLEAVATGRAHSEAGMVRLLGCNASFCSRAADVWGLRLIDSKTQIARVETAGHLTNCALFPRT